MSRYEEKGDLRAKVDWEGGLYEAAYGYGIHAEDIDAQRLPELHAAWAAMDQVHREHFKPAFIKVEDLLYTD